MNKKHFQHELEYGAALSIATSLLRRRLITQTEFYKLKAALINKHRPVISSLQKTVPAISPTACDLRSKESRKRLPHGTNITRNGKEV